MTATDVKPLTSAGIPDLTYGHHPVTFVAYELEFID